MVKRLLSPLVAADTTSLSLASPKEEYNTARIKEMLLFSDIIL
jgi:hypothetical protein